MKLALLKPRRRRCFLHGGLLVLAVYLFLASVSLAQLADTTIAFVSDCDWDWPAEEDQNFEIYLMNPDGKQIRRLTEQPKYDFEPAWSPDGKQITFVSHRDLELIPKGAIRRGEIYLMNVDGSNPINLTQAPERADGVSSWSPDGQQIAFTSTTLFNEDTLADSDIFVMDTSGANPLNLTNHGALDQTPDWSPDGNQIAFTSDRNDNLEIYVMNVDGTNPINLTNHPAKDNHASWSPDGTRIAFDSDRDTVFGRPSNLEIYMMNADGTNPINLTQDPHRDAHPSWGRTPSLSVIPKERLATLWGEVKRIN